MTRVALFGCKNTTLFMLDALQGIVPLTHCVTIDAELGAKQEVADYTDIATPARARGIDVHVAKTYSLKDAGDVAAITAMQLDLAFVIGWQRLLPGPVLASMRVGAFGMHGSSMNLPFGRGRSPMNWSLIEDRKFFHTNLFRYDAGVDSGDVVDTFVFGISAHDTAETMHFKNMLAMRHLIERCVPRLLDGTARFEKQADVTPTYYPKRSPTDSLIDWDRDVFFIDRFVRAVTRPFNGAYTYHDGTRIVILRARVFDSDLVDYGYSDVAVGTVVEVFPSGALLVRCSGGLLLVDECETSVPVRRGERFDNGDEHVRYFALNRLGGHDLEAQD